MNQEIGDAFTRKELPFAEHLVSSGWHHLHKSDFSGEFKHSYGATYRFPNGHRVSLISGPNFYCSTTHPFELYWQTQPVSHSGDGIYGNLNDEHLMLRLAYIINQPELE